MKIVLVSINTKYLHSSLAVWYLLTSLKQNAAKTHDISVVEATINQDIEDTAKAIIDRQPDLVAISTYIWNASLLPSLIQQMRVALGGVVILLGGPEASYNPSYWLNNQADYVLCGEGEFTIVELVNALEEKNESLLDSISGLAYIKDNKLHQNPILATNSRYIDPYSEEYFSQLKGSIAYIESSRGCIFNCSYCLSGIEAVRYFPLEIIKKHIDRLASSGTKTIKFVDRTFNCNLNRAKEIVEYIVSLDTECCFHFEVAADLFDTELLQLLAAAPPGRIRLEIGIQSFSEETLNAVMRRTNLTLVEQNIRLLMQNRNIHIHIDLIAGLPYESLELFINSFNKAYSLAAHTLQLGFLKLLHGSRLREQTEEYGILFYKDPPYEVIRTTWLAENDISILKQVENALNNTYNKGRFLATLNYIMNTTKLSPFDMYYELGRAVPHHMISLQDYTEQITNFLLTLPNVDEKTLRDNIVIDMLRMTKGKGIPRALKSYGEARKRIAFLAKQKLNRNIDYDEVEVLLSGVGVYVDSLKRDPVTELYEIHQIEQ